MELKIFEEHAIRIDEKKKKVYLYIGHITSKPNWELIDLLKQHKHFKIKVYINSTGGSVSGAELLINRIKRYKHVTTIIETYACSMAAYLFLIGHNRIIRKTSVIMFHSMQVDYQRDTYKNIEVDIKSSINHQDNFYFNKIEKYIDSDELLSIKNGLDVSFDYKEMFARGIATQVKG